MFKLPSVEWYEPAQKPPQSSVHGWIKKWRGTFSGDEGVRSAGMREMRRAASARASGQTSQGLTRSLSLSFVPAPKMPSPQPSTSSRDRTSKPAPPLRSSSAPKPSSTRPSVSRSGSGTRSPRPPSAQRQTNDSRRPSSLKRAATSPNVTSAQNSSKPSGHSAKPVPRRSHTYAPDSAGHRRPAGTPTRNTRHANGAARAQ